MSYISLKNTNEMISSYCDDVSSYLSISQKISYENSYKFINFIRKITKDNEKLSKHIHTPYLISKFSCLIQEINDYTKGKDLCDRLILSYRKIKVVELYDYLISNWDSVYNINLTYKVLFALLEIQSKIVYKNCEDELHNIKLI